MIHTFCFECATRRSCQNLKLSVENHTKLSIFINQLLETILAHKPPHLDFVELHYFGEDETKLMKEAKSNGGYAPFAVVMRQFGPRSKPVRNFLICQISLYAISCTPLGLNCQHVVYCTNTHNLYKSTDHIFPII